MHIAHGSKNYDHQPSSIGVEKKAPMAAPTPKANPAEPGASVKIVKFTTKAGKTVEFKRPIGPRKKRAKASK